MKRMYSKEELVEFLKHNSEAIIEALDNQDISIDELTSKGISNTGSFTNTGDVAITGSFTNTGDVAITGSFANNGDATISGNLDVQGEGKGVITANKISQRQSNWEIDVKSILSSSFFKDTSNLYAKMCLIGNELSIVISGKFVAKADSNTYHNIFANQDINIPDEIASKIYRADGTKLTEAKSGTGTYDGYITSTNAMKGNPSIADCSILLQSYAPKNLTAYVYNFGATNEDDVCYIDYRVQLLII